jgi:YfiH family protein
LHDVTEIPEERGGLRVHRIEQVRRWGVDAFVTERIGGVSEGPYASLNLGLHVGDEASNVYENRRRVAEAAGVGIDRLVIVRQVHSSDVVVAEAATPESEADVVTTQGTDLAIAVLVADCVPIVLCDEVSSRVSVAHAGWRGLASGVLASAVGDFDDPARVHAYVGPCISLDSYQVGPEVAAHFCGVPGALHAERDDRSRLDLRAVCVAQLVALGLSRDNLSVTQQVTDRGTTFFSDRAERPCGRFALVARREP